MGVVNRWEGRSLFAPSSGSTSLCAPSPCLFDIVADPTERTDVADENPFIVKRMIERLVELAQGEVTLQASGLCPTKAGSKPDPECLARAEATGFWEPWLKDPVDTSENIVA